MSSVVAQSGAVPSGSGGPGGAVNFGDLDVTFSAPFYTGVFLSSRELQGDYEYSLETGTGDGSRERADLDKGEKYVCHQKIVIEGMEKELPWEWSLPPYFEKLWQRTVSPPYFIRCSVTKDSDLNKLSSKIEKVLSEIAEIELSDLRVESLEVKFYEFAFGSVSIRVKGLELSINAIDLGKDFENILANCEEKIRKILDCITKKITKAYRKSVPCCIKNSDIWDINNFTGLEAVEGICDIGRIQEISTVIAIQQSGKIDLTNIIKELEKVFVDFSGELRKPSFNGSHHLFSTKKQNTTIAASMIPNHEELEDIIDVSEVLGMQLAVGRYFNNFFFSYYNYIACQYEAITSKNMHYYVNIKRIRNLQEKFFDCKIFYSQVQQNILKDKVFDANVYKVKFMSLSPQGVAVQKFWNNSNKSVKEIMNVHNQISAVRSEHSFLTNLDMVYVAISVSLVTFALVILFELFDVETTRPQQVFGFLAFFFFVSSLVILAKNVFGSAPVRKLYYICQFQKHDLWRKYKRQEKINRNKKDCQCGINGCHRCRGIEWHKYVFYLDKNLCFRCGRKESEHHT